MSEPAALPPSSPAFRFCCWKDGCDSVVVEPWKVGGSSSNEKFIPEALSDWLRSQRSLLKLFAFMVVKKLSSMLDSLSSRRDGPGGKAGACSKGVSMGERKESGEISALVSPSTCLSDSQPKGPKGGEVRPLSTLAGPSIMFRYRVVRGGCRSEGGVCAG